MGEEKHELRGGEAGKHQEGGDEGINHVTTLQKGQEVGTCSQHTLLDNKKYCSLATHTLLCFLTHTQSHDLGGF